MLVNRGIRTWEYQHPSSSSFSTALMLKVPNWMPGPGRDARRAGFHLGAVDPVVLHEDARARVRPPTKHFALLTRHLLRHLLGTRVEKHGGSQRAIEHQVLNPRGDARIIRVVDDSANSLLTLGRHYVFHVRRPQVARTRERLRYMGFMKPGNIFILTFLGKGRTIPPRFLDPFMGSSLWSDSWTPSFVRLREGVRPVVQNFL